MTSDQTPPPTAKAPLQLVHEDAGLRVQYLPGTTASLVVAFSGIGHGFGGLQTQEFVGTASDQGRNHVLFVADRQRSWYTTDGLIDTLVNVVGQTAADIGVATCKTIGNSMGGYGAVRFSRDFPVSAVAAFSPQFSMSKAVVPEDRWDQYLPAINFAAHPPLSECLAERTQYYLIFGGLGRTELKHRDLFPARPGVHPVTLPGAGHNVVQKIKEFGLLDACVQAIFACDPARMAQVQADYTAAFTAAAVAAVTAAAVVSPDP